MNDDKLQKLVAQILERSADVRKRALSVQAQIQDIDKLNRTLRKQSYAINEQIQDLCQQSKTMRQRIIKRGEYHPKSNGVHTNKNGQYVLSLAFGADQAGLDPVPDAALLGRADSDICTRAGNQRILDAH